MKRGTEREQDERALKILAMRKMGKTPTEIARHFSRAQQSISRVCLSVAKSDMQHHDPGANDADYRKAYPWVRP